MVADRSGSVASEVHTVGSDVWVRDDKEGWLKARVTKVDGSKLRVKTERDDERDAVVADCPLQNLDARGGVEVCALLAHNVPAHFRRFNMIFTAAWAICRPCRLFQTAVSSSKLDRTAS
jgi:hypothetical protein